MLINRINGKKLKKILEIKFKQYYIAEIEDPEFYGEGETKEEALEDLKEHILDVYQSFKDDEKNVDYKKKILDLFE